MKLGELAEKLGGVCDGDADLEISTLGTLEDAGAGDVTFLAVSTSSEQLAGCAASAVILREEDRDAWQGAAVVCENPGALAVIRIGSALFLRLFVPCRFCCDRS